MIIEIPGTPEIACKLIELCDTPYFVTELFILVA
jgi:hypothetical protein